MSTINNQLNKALSSAPLAGAIPLFDINRNLNANTFLSGLTSITSAAGITTLTVSSNQYQVVVGTTTQTIVLPDATTLADGTSFTIINQSTGVVTINNAIPTTIYTLGSGASVQLILTANGISAGVWDVISPIANPNPVVASTPSFPGQLMSVWKGGNYIDGTFNPSVLMGTFDAYSAAAKFTTLDLGSIQEFLPNVTDNPTFTNLTSFTASELTSINGTFSYSFPLLTTLSMPNLVNVNGDFQPTFTMLTSFSLPNFTMLNGSFSANFTALTSLSSNLTWIGNGFTPELDAATSISFPNLTYTGGTIGDGSSYSLLTSWSMPLLTSIGNGSGNAFTQQCPLLTSINFNSLVTVNGRVYLTWDAITTVSFPALVTINGSFVGSFAAATSFSFPNLVTINGSLGNSLSIPSMVTLSFPALQTISNALGPFTAGSLTSFTLPAIETIGSISLTAAALSTFTLNSGLLTVNGNVIMSGCALNQASVDGILVSLANLNGSGGTTSYNSLTVNLSGGTSSTPSATGLTAKATLVGRGCNVITN